MILVKIFQIYTEKKRGSRKIGYPLIHWLLIILPTQPYANDHKLRAPKEKPSSKAEPMTPSYDFIRIGCSSLVICSDTESLQYVKNWLFSTCQNPKMTSNQVLTKSSNLHCNLRPPSGGPACRSSSFGGPANAFHQAFGGERIRNSVNDVFIDLSGLITSYPVYNWIIVATWVPTTQQTASGWIMMMAIDFHAKPPWNMLARPWRS